jgi:16S rRNA (guanine966-N2)-methyltransferase
MRIIAGQYRSRTLQAPPGNSTRPTSDRLRETLFNILAPRIVAARMLDLYAGSGAVGIEALSRGASSVEFVERDPAAIKVMHANLNRLGIAQGFKIQSGSVATSLRRMKPVPAFDLVFLDPPYDAEQEYAATLGLLGSLSVSFLSEGALIIAEHRKKKHLEEKYGDLVRIRVLEKGDAALSFYLPGFLRQPKPLSIAAEPATADDEWQP